MKICAALLVSKLCLLTSFATVSLNIQTPPQKSIHEQMSVLVPLIHDVAQGGESEQNVAGHPQNG